MVVVGRTSNVDLSYKSQNSRNYVGRRNSASKLSLMIQVTLSNDQQSNTAHNRAGIKHSSASRGI
jgi:hypothetical protein